MNQSKPLLQVDVLRGSTVESSHLVKAVALNMDGQIFEQIGTDLDLTHPIFPRSSIKPLQALLFIESGAWSASGLDERFLTLACSSHQGEAIHLELVHEWMEKFGFTEEDFACGGHWPGHLESQYQMIRNKKMPPPSANNCSGKHLGLLTVCRHLGYPTRGYEKWNHPLQRDLRRLLSRLVGENLELAPWGIDGCGIPTLAFRMAHLARGMRILLTDEPAVQRLVAAIQKYPELIGGTEDFTSQVIAASRGRALIKTGAEGVFAGVVFPQKIAFTVKALDGQSRASQAATAYLLQKWGALDRWEVPPIRNWKGEQVGSIHVIERKQEGNL